MQLKAKISSLIFLNHWSRIRLNSLIFENQQARVHIANLEPLVFSLKKRKSHKELWVSFLDKFYVKNLH
jgi:hypothetical protein